jgi:hypothetical protein
VLLLKRPNASARKLAANRRNALKSRGPRPSEVKRRARLNAWKDARHVRTSAEDLLERLLRRRAHGGEDQKKESLNLTNKAIMLLKTNDRPYEQSRTKPIVSEGKASDGAAGCACPGVPGTAVFVLVGERSALPMTREPGRLPYPNKRAGPAARGRSYTSACSHDAAAEPLKSVKLSHGVHGGEGVQPQCAVHGERANQALTC